MRLKVWEPFGGFKPFHGDLNNWFDEVEGALDRSAWHPKVDVFETADSFKLKADLPGVAKEDIKIDINNGTLSLKGEKKFEEKVEKENYLRVERSYGTFTRSFSLSENVNTENITANYKDGVLEITLPKKEEAKPKEITVEVN